MKNYCFLRSVCHSIKMVIYNFLLIFISIFSTSFTQQPPNIIVIVASDLGWNDVGFHGSNQIPTPNLDALAYNGIILNSHYVQPLSGSTLSGFFTGKYPYKLGLQGVKFHPGQTASLPAEKLLPEYLKDLGYETHLVGKWGLGYSKLNDTPLSRGFDHHFGFFNEWVSYYDYLNTFKINGKDYSGFDLRNDHELAWEKSGKYATDVFTEFAVNLIENHDSTKPIFLTMAHLAVHAGNEGKLLEAPQDAINTVNYIIDSNRRSYAAMVTKLDESVGQLMSSLHRKKMLRNSVVLFFSDNGAPTEGAQPNWGSNHPLKGIKGTVHEGGVRSTSFIWSPLLPQASRISNELIHITDWLPTFYSLAGGDVTLVNPDLDGVDQWSSLQFDLPSGRNDILINIDETTKNAAILFANWKLVIGTSFEGEYDNFFGDSGEENRLTVPYDVKAVVNSPAGQISEKVNFSPVTENQITVLREQATLKCLAAKASRNPCNVSESAYCLYDIPNDPCEENNLATLFPAVVRRMKRALVEYKAFLLPQVTTAIDIEKSDPKLFNFTWTTWLDCSDKPCTTCVISLFLVTTDEEVLRQLRLVTTNSSLGPTWTSACSGFSSIQTLLCVLCYLLLINV